MKVILKEVRFAFPALFEAKGIAGDPNSKPVYSITGLMAPGSANEKLVTEAIEKVAKEKWKDKAPAILAGLRKKDRTCLRDGNDKVKYDGFAGMMYISASNPVRPTVKNRDNTPLTKEDGKPYGGCYGNLVVDIWAMDNKFGQRVNASLLGAQFVKDGDSFGGGERFADDDFADLGDQGAEAGADATAGLT